MAPYSCIFIIFYSSSIIINYNIIDGTDELKIHNESMLLMIFRMNIFIALNKLTEFFFAMKCR